MTTRMMQKVLAVLRGMLVVLVVLVIKVLIAPRGFSRHLIQPPKICLVLDFLQYSLYCFSEYGIDSLCVGCSGLPYEVPPRAVVVIPIRLEIPPLLRDNLLFSSSLQLVFLHSLILVNPIHQLAHAGGGFAGQRLPQTVIGW